MSRGGPLRVLDDATPLHGPEIDPAVRIGWLLRTARMCHPDESVRRLSDMADRVDSNPTRLHRLETGRLREGALIDAYERVMELPEGSLRAPVDILARTFPTTTPPDRDPGRIVETVDELSRLTERLLDESSAVTGGTWLAWARALGRPGAIGLPDWLAHRIVARLVRELNCSVSHGYPSRYEALALVRCSPYGGLVVDVARECLADPHVQIIFDMMSAVGEAVTADAVAWSLELLTDSRELVVTGAALALENMGQVSGDPAFWQPLVGPLAALFHDAPEGSAAWEWLSHLLRLVPTEVRERSGVQVTRPLAPTSQTRAPTRSVLDAHWADCLRRSSEIAWQAGLEDHSLLARLLFDTAYSPFESRAVTSYVLVGALDPVAEPFAAQIVDLVDGHEDPVIRGRAVRRLPGTRHGYLPSAAKAWLDGDDPVLRGVALLLVAGAGVHLDTEVLQDVVRRGGDEAKRAILAAGVTGHPVLEEWAHAADDDLRGRARWWQRQGTRITR